MSKEKRSSIDLTPQTTPSISPIFVTTFLPSSILLFHLTSLVSVRVFVGIFRASCAAAAAAAASVQLTSVQIVCILYTSVCVWEEEDHKKRRTEE